MPGRIDHIGIGVENFDADRIARELQGVGIEGFNFDGTSVFACDPDGAMVQLSAADWDGS